MRHRQEDPAVSRVAREQVAAADAILALHRPAGAACGCGRPMPCGQAEAIRARRAEHLRAMRRTARAVVAVTQVADQRQS